MTRCGGVPLYGEPRHTCFRRRGCLALGRLLPVVPTEQLAAAAAAATFGSGRGGDIEVELPAHFNEFGMVAF
ncbi:hypothetical protein GCM10025778_26080 [Paeniglutamicibacter antarcticus]|uniref:Uncharacterized protein n=1 Tax=Paeniglutamicibacter antarcticus TaxID=494023 RepID=A0ABP9TPF4_9MICC